MKYDLADRTVAITGAAGGLGADLAKAMRARGARIALLDLNRDAVCELADRLGGDSVARGWRADVEDLDNLDQVMSEVAAHFERLDVVVAGAGVGSAIGPITALRRPVRPQSSKYVIRSGFAWDRLQPRALARLPYQSGT